MLDDIEKHVQDRYGPIRVDKAWGAWVSIFVAVVPLCKGVAIGMGLTRQLAIHDLYLDLIDQPRVQRQRVRLDEWWLRRREQMNRAQGKTWSVLHDGRLGDDKRGL